MVEAGYLYLQDLYSLSIKADLAALGSCETGNGMYKKGEGIKARTRATNLTLEAGAR